MTKVLYPGSFDPFTKGHMNIIDQAQGLFDEVVVAVLHNPYKKNSFFTTEERLVMIKEIYEKQYNNIKIVSGMGAAVDMAILYQCQAIIRGLRSLSDYDYEVQLSQINKDISNNEINTVCLFADKEFQFISSSMVKEIFNLGKDIEKYVDPIIKEKMLIKKGSV